MLHSTMAPFLMGLCCGKLAIEDMHARLLCMLGVFAMEGMQRLSFIKPLCSCPLSWRAVHFTTYVPARQVCCAHSCVSA